MAFPFKLLKVSADLSADADYAGTQVAPADTVTLIVPQTVGQIVNAPVQLELVVEWLDAAEDVVAGAGSFDLAVVRVTDRAANAGDGSIIVDSVSITGQGSRPIIIGDVRIGDTVGVRLTNITGPGSTETHYRVLYRELWG